MFLYKEIEIAAHIAPNHLHYEEHPKKGIEEEVQARAEDVPVKVGTPVGRVKKPHTKEVDSEIKPK